jgi:lipopolysaccharide/colanic/teichoic acid biosynthesis glycosyltransferase
LIYLTIDGYIGSNGAFQGRVVVHSITFSLLVYVFGGLEKKERFPKNEIVLYLFLSFLISTAFLLIYVALFSVPIGYYYLMSTSIYSLLVVPFLIFYIYKQYYVRLRPQKILMIGEGKIWDRSVEKILSSSFDKVESIEYCSSEVFFSGRYSEVEGNRWTSVIAISPSDFLYREAKERRLNIASAGRYAENYLIKIPLDIIRCNENHYIFSFEDVGVNPLIRILDVIFSLLILTLASPFLLLSIVCIRLIDRMPVFYYQERRGYRSKRFLMYKLTTMKSNPKTGEYYVTSLGKILRILRLNEIPQLLNVVKAEMSLVGPRPDIESTYSFCMEKIPYYHYRTNVLPGITGHAQVHFRYVDKLEEETFSERLSYDLYYVKKYSIFLYLITLMKTVGTVLLLKGK